MKRETEDIDATIADLKAAVAEARKIVKIEFTKAQWIEFGSKAKR